eukprot:TRINITY_DN10459_c0_g1_i1.p1 TRINITY_DN10459_c0_g1~~TRINITY_DN10459_c0_g1_i1.p1  ORF type:complete len:343 (+),score=79.90 TRINITY_DN10459_c0_g1_i1:23-1030(+)
MLNSSSDITNLIEHYIKRKLEIYDLLGKSPSFASFELAVGNSEGVVFVPPSTYKIFDLETLHVAWVKNMNLLTKRKKSANHWQAGLKKWLNGAWRKDEKPFDLELKETKIAEANDFKGYVAELFKLNENIAKLVAAPNVIVHHHHHYYCKCHPTTQELDLKYDEVYTQQLDNGEVHHYHVHPITQTVPGLESCNSTKEPVPLKYEQPHSPMYVDPSYSNPVHSQVYGTQGNYGSNQQHNMYGSPELSEPMMTQHQQRQAPQNIFQQIEWPPFLQEFPSRFPSFDNPYEQNLELPEIRMDYPAGQRQNTSNPFQMALHDISSGISNIFRPQNRSNS